MATVNKIGPLSAFARNCAFTCLIASFFPFLGCGLTTPIAKLPPASREGKAALTLEGRLTAVDGQAVDLAVDTATIQVVMFVSETCAICRHETQTLVVDRQNRGRPTNAKFYSVVVGSNSDDARDWRDELKVNWTVGVDVGDPLFRKYCPDLQTPCVLLTNPASGSATQLVGAHSLDEWEKITGPWRY